MNIKIPNTRDEGDARAHFPPQMCLKTYKDLPFCFQPIKLEKKKISKYYVVCPSTPPLS